MWSLKMQMPSLWRTSTTRPFFLLQGGAWVTPLWHGVALCRAAALGTLGFAAAIGHSAYLLALLACGVAYASRNYRRRLIT